MSAPQLRHTVNGRPIAQAPTYLKPYLDCVTGATLYATGLTPSNRIIAKWVLFRENEEVGRLTIDTEGQRPW